MVFKNPKEQGSRSPIDLRLGITVEKFGGVDLEKDAGGISDARFRSLINVRLTQGPIRERGGQVKTNTTAVGKIEGFIDTSDIGAPVEVATPLDILVPALSPGGDTVIIGYNTSLGVVVSNVFSAAGGASQYKNLRLLRGLDGLIYGASSLYTAASGDYRSSVHRVDLSPFTKTLIWAASAADDSDGINYPVRPAEDPSAPLKFVHGHARRWSGGVLQEPGDVYYDGALDDTIALAAGGGGNEIAVPEFVAFNNSIYAPITAETTAVRTIRRRTGAATWVNLGLGGFPADFRAYSRNFHRGVCAAVYNGVLYVSGIPGGAGTGIYYLAVSSGNVVTLAATVEPGIAYTPHTVVTFAGKLCYFFGPEGVAGSNRSYLGTFDGTTWITTTATAVWDGLIGGIKHLVSGCFTDGVNLWAVADSDDSGGGFTTTWLIKSAGSNLASWSRVVRLMPDYALYDVLGVDGAAAVAVESL